MTKNRKNPSMGGDMACIVSGIFPLAPFPPPVNWVVKQMVGGPLSSKKIGFFPHPGSHVLCVALTYATRLYFTPPLV